MTRLQASIGFVMASALAGALFVGCSDDSKSTSSKPTVDAGKRTSNRAQIAAESPTPSAELKVTAKETTKPEVKPELKPDMAADVKPNVKPEAKTDAKPEVKPDVKPDVKTDAKPEVKTEPKPPEGKVDVKADPDAEPNVDAKPEGKPEPKPDSKPQSAKEASPTSTSAGDDDAATKFSTFASADDLAAELKILVTDLEKAVVSEAEFASQVDGRFTRDGNTITLIAIALGLHDQDSTDKPAAKAIAAAARQLAEAKGYAATKQAVEDLKAAVQGDGKGSSDLKWGKVSKLAGLMKDEVPAVNTRLKTGLRHFKKRAGDVAANAATMALIAENAKLYVADTKQPGEGQKWTEFAAQMRASAVELAVKAHAGDEPGAKAAMEKLDQSCHDCHAVFNPEKQQ